MRRFLAAPFFVIAFIAVAFIAVIVGPDDFERWSKELDSEQD